MAATDARAGSAGKLKHPREFRAVFTQGARLAAGCFLIYAYRNGMPAGRLGLAIAKRQVPTAVARNRLKRLIRESFRANKERLKGYDLVVVARRPASAMSNREVQQQLLDAWKQVFKDEAPGGAHKRPKTPKENGLE